MTVSLLIMDKKKSAMWLTHASRCFVTSRWLFIKHINPIAVRVSRNDEKQPNRNKFDIRTENSMIKKLAPQEILLDLITFQRNHDT